MGEGLRVLPLLRDNGRMNDDCELCATERVTEWFYEDDLCWVAECEQCYVPMVVWKRHDPNPSEGTRVVMHTRLSEVVVAHYGYEFWLDENMRSIPTHYHAHARPRGGFYGHGLRRG